MFHYDHWKTFANNEVKANTDIEVWRMQNDQAYIEKFREEMGVIFDLSD